MVHPGPLSCCCNNRTFLSFATARAVTIVVTPVGRRTLAHVLQTNSALDEFMHIIQTLIAFSCLHRFVRFTLCFSERFKQSRTLPPAARQRIQPVLYARNASEIIRMVSRIFIVIV